ncbi:MAG TPA: hypothetical protein PLG66_17490, partial [Calditrichia bacterium]|nr:hypothetical protein [Calditrichia bacterium]
MRSLRLFTGFLMLLSISLNAQIAITNGDFETWTNGEPFFWVTSNVPGLVSPVTESNDAHSGASAVGGEVLSFQGVPFGPNLTLGNLTQAYMPISGTPTALTGFYQLSLTSPATDSLAVVLLVLDANFSVVGQANLFLRQEASSYTAFNSAVTYSSSETPAFVQLHIVLIPGGGAASVGSTFKMDDLVMEGITAIEPVDNVVPGAFALSQNYPNPFNPGTHIDFSIAQAAAVRLDIYNSLGQRVE